MFVGREYFNDQPRFPSGMSVLTVGGDRECGSLIRTVGKHHIKIAGKDLNRKHI